MALWEHGKSPTTMLEAVAVRRHPSFTALTSMGLPKKSSSTASADGLAKTRLKATRQWILPALFGAVSDFLTYLLHDAGNARPTSIGGGKLASAKRAFGFGGLSLVCRGALNSIQIFIFRRRPLLLSAASLSLIDPARPSTSEPLQSGIPRRRRQHVRPPHPRCPRAAPMRARRSPRHRLLRPPGRASGHALDHVASPLTPMLHRPSVSTPRNGWPSTMARRMPT